MQRTLVSLVLALATIIAFQQPAQAVVYRWVDDQGVVHFAQEAPPGIKATPVDIRHNVVSSAPAEPVRSAPGKGDIPADSNAPGQEEISYAESRRRERAENRIIRAEEARRTEAACQVMRQQKAQVESGPRVLVKGENGEPRRLLDSEREDLLNEANTFLAANCN